MPARCVQIGPLEIGNDLPFVLIAGPCPMESRAHALETARRSGRDGARKRAGRLVYKTSFDKANRTSSTARAASGLDRGHADPRRGPRDATACPVIDRRPREPSSARRSRRSSTSCRSRPSSAARPICSWPRPRPASRSTSRRASSWRPGTWRNVAAKIERFAGSERILLCERGASFGYNTLVTDMRAPADHGRDRLPGGVRCDPFGASSRAASVTPPAASASSCRCWREPPLAVGVAALFSRPTGPRPGADRWPEHGAAEAELPALLEALIAFDRLAKRHPLAAECQRRDPAPSDLRSDHDRDRDRRHRRAARSSTAAAIRPSRSTSRWRRRARPRGGALGRLDRRARGGRAARRRQGVYGGKGVLQAVEAVNGEIFDALLGLRRRRISWRSIAR